MVNQRLVGEIHLDGFDVSHTKDNILWRGSQEDDVEEGLKDHCASYRDFAKKRRLDDDDDQRAPSDADTKVALDDIKRELTSPEMVDQINISIIPTPETIRASKEKIIESVVETRDATEAGTIGSTPSITWQVFLQKMSSNDPYVVSDSTVDNEITVIVNQNHPYFTTQLCSLESLRDYFRQCIYDSVAQWQARAKTSKIDPDTIMLLKDRLFRVPFEMESHATDEEVLDEPES